jgi:type II secretory pathway pseudopilin PulG
MDSSLGKTLSIVGAVLAVISFLLHMMSAARNSDQQEVNTQLQEQRQSQEQALKEQRSQLGYQEFDDSTLKTFVEIANFQLPKDISVEERLEKLIHYPGRKIARVITLVKVSIKDFGTQKTLTPKQQAELNDTFLPNLKKSVCSNPFDAKLLKDGVKIIFIFSTREGLDLTRISMLAKTCGFK